MCGRSPARCLCALLVLACCACAGTACFTDGPGALHTLRERRAKMGTWFEIQVVVDDVAAGRAAIETAFGEIDRIEALLSEWRETSEISRLNRRAGSGPFVVGPELFDVVRRSLEISEQTEGAFDVTFAACGGLWSFDPPRLPDEAEIAACLVHVDFRRIRLDDALSAITLPDPAMRIGIAGIGKGYGVDRAADVLESSGVARYIVDGGGDIRISGTAVARPWRVGVADPRRRGELFATLEADRGAVVSSGDYERYFERDGVRYHHILDPRTGRPAGRSVAVTVIAPTATEADALATGLFVMGPRSGLELVEALAGVEALFFGPDLQVQRSSGFPALDPVAEN